ncbi:class I SAM-dependent methyltransferase [Salimicrobium halophilum]|uniref:Methyltransferase domain-containing protein n=1 Tax=Salimicrobium halophilum TaxID=86666 RepID=A0A1G8RHC1_9BACI|nr:class I SAM-dependent methyltransferase [Salimicrobium halophilum]SDJ16368.1 Methyltransferase domain-containing protein [Salimicrobium halophilum]
MGIDFHSNKNRFTYTTRTADPSWKKKIAQLVPIGNVSMAADIGCGGGIYTRALADMGVTSVIGVDFSEEILGGARENCDEPHISFCHGSAYDTGLSSNSLDLVLERALIHHLDDLHNCFDEAYRVLENNGCFVVQDRTPEDCLLKGSTSHIRGYMFELFPDLIDKEVRRRYSSQAVVETLKSIGFREIEEVKLWEIRQEYSNKNQLLEDLRERTGKSILHELNDRELEKLMNHVDQSLPNNEIIVEKDRWTIWKVVK